MEFENSGLQKRVDVKFTTAAGHQYMTLHCQQCKTVLADSFGVVGELECMDSIISTRVTDDVDVSDAVVVGHKGEMANCVHSPLNCSSCHCEVGKVIHSAPSYLDSVRSMFLLHKANISCYILDCSSMVKATTLTFDLKPVQEAIDETKQELGEQIDQLFHRQNRLADMIFNRDLSK